jgi:nucleotide-binding universal stress UspA family protein
MVNILVPTDFSNLSKVALQYAIKIANKLDGNVTVLHVIDLNETVLATMRMKISVKAVMHSAKEEMEKLIKEVSKYRPKKEIKSKIVRDTSFADAVKKNSKRLRSGLIVMGTRGATGFKKAILGSNTTSVIGFSHVPVLAVPEEAEFKNFRNVIYATDLKHIEKELAILIPYIEKFGSTIHILHILKDATDMDKVEAQIEMAVKKTGYKNIVTLVTVDSDIDGAIDQYVIVSKADLLTMFTHQLSFFERIFDRSITRKMAFHSKTALLTFKSDFG